MQRAITTMLPSKGTFKLHPESDAKPQVLVGEYRMLGAMRPLVLGADQARRCGGTPAELLMRGVDGRADARGAGAAGTGTLVVSTAFGCTVRDTLRRAAASVSW